MPECAEHAGLPREKQKEECLREKGREERAQVDCPLLCATMALRHAKFKSVAVLIEIKPFFTPSSHTVAKTGRPIPV